MDHGFQSVFFPRKKDGLQDLSFLGRAEAEKARSFHKGFDVYEKTPLVKLRGLAQQLGVASVHVKDESFRFGLNAFKVLGGSYALGRYIASLLGEEIGSLSPARLASPETHRKTGELTFVTATDGNHGRGMAWTARRLGHRSVVYMPHGSAPERLRNIRSEGAEASITDMNYDEAVRYANEKARTEGWVMVQDTAWEGYTDIPTYIMQGYTTMGHEIQEQLTEQGERMPTHLFLQAGVGSMSGAMAGFFASAFGEDRPITAIVEPDKADCLFQTAKADDGRLHFVTGALDTIMAGLACGEPCTIGWNVLLRCADAFFSCPDYVAADGMRILAAPARGDTPIISGESGAATTGCLANLMLRDELSPLRRALRLDEHSRVLLISTEGDTDRQNYRDVVWGGRYNRFDTI